MLSRVRGTQLLDGRDIFVRVQILLIVVISQIGCQGSSNSKLHDRVDLVKDDSAPAYVNENFAIRLEVDSEWEIVGLSEVRAVAKERNVDLSVLKNVPITFRRRTSGDDGASLMIAIEPLPDKSKVKTGEEYLRQALTIIKNRAEPPRNIVFGDPLKQAGLVFNQMSLSRSWDGTEIQMEFWATVKNHQALAITGSYKNDAGQTAVRSLFERLQSSSGTARQK